MAGVSNFVLISTDKAVRPTNVMGATKRLAEMALQALAAEQRVPLFAESEFKVTGKIENNTYFTLVRFGNVLGSSGSVIPKFRQQIKMGGPTTVTHPNITRYFMTIPEAAQLVIQAGAMGGRGDLFVLDMGESVRIVDLAEKMVRLAGLTLRSEVEPDGDIELEFTGLRLGEKLYEELLIGDNVDRTDHPMIMRAQEEYISWEALQSLLGQIEQALASGDFQEVRTLMVSSVSGYRPDSSIVDWMYRS